MALPPIFSYQFCAALALNRRFIAINSRVNRQFTAITELSHLPNVVVQEQTVRANYRSPPENFDPSRSAFQGHTRSSEPTRIDRLSMISYD